MENKITDVFTSPEAKSAYFSELAKKRKNPYLPFKDKVYAKQMSDKAQEKRDAQEKVKKIRQSKG